MRCGASCAGRRIRSIKLAELSAVRSGPRVAIVGGDSLLAKEIRELLNQSSLSPRVELISSAADNSTILETLLKSSADEDPTVLTPLTPESLTGSKVAFLTGSAASSRRAMKANPEGGPVLVDLTGALEDRPEARLRAPLFESVAPASSPIQVIAHPAAIAIAMLLETISRHAKIQRSLVHVFEPASERGKAGLDELQQQTVAVLSFKKLKTDVFDSQLGFNMLARYGEEAQEPLQDIEARIERHLASLLAALRTPDGGAIPMPSLRLIQAPVFHGHSFSVWIELAEDPAPETLAGWINTANIDVRPDDPPSNANIAGQSGLSAGAIYRDPNHPRGYWLWLVADNLRVAAENALAVAQEFL